MDGSIVSDSRPAYLKALTQEHEGRAQGKELRKKKKKKKTKNGGCRIVQQEF